MQEWVQQHPQAAPQADNSSSTSFLAEHALALGESAELFYPSLLFTDSDFTTTLDSSFYYDNNENDMMLNTHAQTIYDQLDGSLTGRQQSDYYMLAARSCSSDHSTLPASSGRSLDTSDTLDPMAAGLQSGQSSPKKRPANDSSERTSTSPSSVCRFENDDRSSKRQRNTEAARRYRQRKVDRVTELEDALAAVTKERDDLKLKLARSEAEADVLRGIVGKRI